MVVPVSAVLLSLPPPHAAMATQRETAARSNRIVRDLLMAPSYMPVQRGSSSATTRSEGTCSQGNAP